MIRWRQLELTVLKCAIAVVVLAAFVCTYAAWWSMQQ